MQRIQTGEDGTPIVSVIVPTSNAARYLPEAIASVQAQNFAYWECIVVDDGSTDSTPHLLERLRQSELRLRVIRREAAGVSAARNAGLAVARGRYVQFLDADDRLHPTKLALHVAELDARPEVGVVFGTAAFITEGEGEALRRLSDPAGWFPAHSSDYPSDEVLRLLLVQNLFTIEAPLTRRAVIDAAGPFDECLTRMEDWDLWVRASLAGTRFVFMSSPEPLVTVRVHTGSTSQPEAAMIDAELRVRTKLDVLLRDLPVARAINRARLERRQMELSVLRTINGSATGGWRTIIMLAVRHRRPRWLVWALILPLARLRGGRRLLGRVWSARRHARRSA